MRKEISLGSLLREIYMQNRLICQKIKSPPAHWPYLIVSEKTGKTTHAPQIKPRMPPDKTTQLCLRSVNKKLPDQTVQ